MQVTDHFRRQHPSSSDTYHSEDDPGNVNSSSESKMVSDEGKTLSASRQDFIHDIYAARQSGPPDDSEQALE